MRYRLLVLVLLPYSLSAATVAMDPFILRVAAVSNLTVSGNPAPLTIMLDSSGVGRASDSSTSYTVFSNAKKGRFKIIGMLSKGGALPTNTTLFVQLDSSSGTSLGLQPLNTSSTDLVINLPSLVTETGNISYLFQVQNGWQIPAQTLMRTVTLTLVATSP
ncbi:MAG: hypothetical protein FJZ58_01200 [Chlamydiae bacterium]|nr:hypothetical protein [Chlamydiota bacterium]